jgi:hypothetical protein
LPLNDLIGKDAMGASAQLTNAPHSIRFVSRTPLASHMPPLSYQHCRQLQYFCTE